MSRHKLAIIGGGPAGLMAAETLAVAGYRVDLYERMPTLGRKFLMAGRGGLNLTHSEAMERFLPRYREAAPHLAAAIAAFTPDALRSWSEGLGQETFIGTSGRVFPTVMKASPLLRAWLKRLEALGVAFHLRHRWLGWGEEGQLLFETPAGPLPCKPDATLLALGGASWPKLGSDGGFMPILEAAGAAIRPFKPANCGFGAAWSDIFVTRFAGEALKRVALKFRGEIARGEAIITQGGIEGSAIYALSAPLREAIMAEGKARLIIDCLPDLKHIELVARLSVPRGKQSLATFLRKAAGLSPVAIGLAQEVAHRNGITLAALKADDLAGCIKNASIELAGIAAIERAISSAGGVTFAALDAHFMLKARAGVFAAGEMLDWEAPTGGYLLQAAFATGRAAALGAIGWLQGRE